jgi:hypothetical protein
MKSMIILGSLALASCVSTTTTTMLPDGTITVIEQRGIDQASVAAGTEISVAAAAEISRTIRPTK